MPVIISLDPTAFNPGNRFAGLNPAKVVIPVGTGKPFAEFLASPKMTSVKDRPVGTFQLLVTINGQMIETYHWTAMREAGINLGNIFTSLADLVEKGLVIVSVDGAVQTPEQIVTG
jgi:hypothetical protein